MSGHRIMRREDGMYEVVRHSRSGSCLVTRTLVVGPSGSPPLATRVVAASLHATRDVSLTGLEGGVVDAMIEWIDRVASLTLTEEFQGDELQNDEAMDRLIEEARALIDRVVGVS